MEPQVHAEIGAMLDVAAAGDTVRLGRLLAPFGIDYVIFQPQLAPAPYEGPSYDIDPALARMLDDQLDLRRQSGTLNLLVFRNEASSGAAVVVDTSFDPATSTVVDLLDLDLSSARSLLPARQSATSVEFDSDPALRAGDRILVSRPAEGWQPTGGASEIAATFGQLALLTVDDPSVPFGMSYVPPRSWWRWSVVQAILILGAVVVGSRTEESPTRREPETLDLDLRSDREIARRLEVEDLDREPVGDAL
jgi:hypothetical protein